MSYYDNQQWQTGGQPSWDQLATPNRSGASSAVPREDSAAFSTQFEEVDRAIDNLGKSGKMFSVPGRRDSLPMGGPPPRSDFQGQYDPRMGGGPPRPHASGSDFGGDNRSYSGSNLQNFYATQRHQPSRGANEAEQVMQAKRRMAAQREKELRNYHQEQQYNRSAVGNVSSPFSANPADRTMSPGSGMSEEERRDLIARQRSALYGGEAAQYQEGSSFDENGTPRPGSGPHSTTRGHSPLAFDHFNAQANQEQNQQIQEPQSATQGPQRSRANSTSSPSSNPTTSFGLFDSTAHQQSSRTSTSSPGGSPPRQGKPASSGVAPIGTRPAQAANPQLKPRSTTPLPSPLNYGYTAEEAFEKNSKDNRATSAAGNPSSAGGWGGKNAIWGKAQLGTQQNQGTAWA